VLAILRSKHPEGNPDAIYILAPDGDLVFESVTADKIVQAISSFQMRPPVAWMIFSLNT
jgi:hypothetical protein